jgi:hypothetical protein
LTSSLLASFLVVFSLPIFYIVLILFNVLFLSRPFPHVFPASFLFMCVSCLPYFHVRFLSPFLSKYLSCLLHVYSVYLNFNVLTLSPFLSLCVSFRPSFPYVFPVSLVFKCENDLLCFSSICAWLPSFPHNIYSLSPLHTCVLPLFRHIFALICLLSRSLSTTPPIIFLLSSYKHG